MKNDLNIRCLMSRDELQVTGTEQAVYVLVDIRPAGQAPGRTLPANVGLVLDRSGSMDGEKLDRLKEAVGHVAENLGADDRISVTIFDDQVETLIPNGRATDRSAVMTKVGAVIARGGTQISDGLRAGLTEVRNGLAADRVSRIVLLTDGRTWDDEDACLAIADEAAAEGIAITSIGIGEDWNEKLLLRIAERSRGNSHWIEEPSAIVDAFRHEVEGLQSVAATNLRVTARMSEGVRPVKAYAASPLISDLSGTALSGGTVSANLGQFDGKKGQAMLIEVRVPAARAGRFRLGQVEVAYDLPSADGKARSVRSDLFVTFTNDAAASPKVNAEVMNLVEKVSAFKLQTRALTEAEAGNIAAATQKLRSAATVLLDLGEDELAAAAEAEALSLRKTGSLTSSGTKKLEYGTRKLTQALK